MRERKPKRVRPHVWADIDGRRTCAACGTREDWPLAQMSCPIIGDEWAYPELRPWGYANGSIKLHDAIERVRQTSPRRVSRTDYDREYSLRRRHGANVFRCGHPATEENSITIWNGRKRIRRCILCRKAKEGRRYDQCDSSR